MTVLAVFVAGGLGAACRYLVDGLLQERRGGAFPLGTLVVNVSGSLLLGVITGFAVSHLAFSPPMRAALAPGFVGAYTTFSTLTYETLRLVRDGARGLAALNMGLSLVLGVAAAALGLWLGGA